MITQVVNNDNILPSLIIVGYQ